MMAYQADSGCFGGEAGEDPIFGLYWVFGCRDPVERITPIVDEPVAGRVYTGTDSVDREGFCRSDFSSRAGTRGGLRAWIRERFRGFMREMRDGIQTNVQDWKQSDVVSFGPARARRNQRNLLDWLPNEARKQDESKDRNQQAKSRAPGTNPVPGRREEKAEEESKINRYGSIRMDQKDRDRVMKSNEKAKRIQNTKNKKFKDSQEGGDGDREWCREPDDEVRRDEELMNLDGSI